jgi:cytoskeletal protein CcmA (bactofilin family)
MSFRKYGGTQFASSHNVVKSNINTTGSFYVTENIGQPNTYINFESDISGNIIIYGDLDVSGNLSVTGDIDCSGNVNIDGDVDINGKLHVQEDIDCSGNVNIDGNIDCIGDITANEFFITGPIDSAPNSVVPKSYVDSVAVGLTPLAPCDVCSNAAALTSLSGLPIIDGVQTTANMRILVNAQGGFDSAGNAIPDIANGVYVVSSGSWTRASD